MTFPDTKLEEKLWSKGYTVVVGIDEAGRGPLAGPVAAGAVAITPNSEVIDIVKDSKKMTRRKREEAEVLIKDRVLGYGVGMIDSKIIDSIGIQDATCRAMEEALSKLEDMIGMKADYLIVDGLNVEQIGEYPMMKIKNGDLNHYSISCASVLAKVQRDRLMLEYSKMYPEYGFEKNMGYGTKQHLEALEKYGICDIHRRSYKPVNKFVV